MKNIGLEVKKILTEKKLSVSDLAKMINTSKQNLTPMLNKGDMKVSVFEKVCKALDVPYEHFIDKTETEIKAKGVMKPKVIVQIELDETQNEKVLTMVLGKEFLTFLNK
jgi:DNA-binding Xre family transcriptional regulator